MEAFDVTSCIHRNRTACYIHDEAMMLLEKLQVLGVRAVLLLSMPGRKPPDRVSEVWTPRCQLTETSSTCLQRIKDLYDVVTQGWTPQGAAGQLIGPSSARGEAPTGPLTDPVDPQVTLLDPSVPLIGPRSQDLVKGLHSSEGRPAASTVCPNGVLQVRGRSFTPYIKQEEGGAPGPERPNTGFTQSPDWPMERSETDQSPSSNQIPFFGEEEVLSVKQEVRSVKQEVDEDSTMLEAAVKEEISSQQEGALQFFTSDEEQQVRGRSFSLHIKQEEGGASEPEETITKFTQSPDWLMESYKDEGSSSSIQILFFREGYLLPTQSDSSVQAEPGGACAPTDHNRDSMILYKSCTEDSSDGELEPGLQRTQGTGPRPPAEQNLLFCGTCGRGFNSKRTLEKHMSQNMLQGQMSCSLHSQRASFQSADKSFGCRICGSSFSTQGILLRHAQNHCKEPGSQCGACGDCLESTEALKDHLRSHKELGSTCDVCGKKSSSIKRMEIHKRVHTGEKPYCCEFCSRDFSRKESLERHLKIHSGERPHRCGLCRRTFTRREYLVNHLKISHTESPPAGTKSFSMVP